MNWLIQSGPCRTGAIILWILLPMAGCGGDFCVGAKFCSGGSFEVEQRQVDSNTMEYTIAGEIDGDEISHSFALYESEVIEGLSFGLENAWAFRRYGGQKKIDLLSDAALEQYQQNYVIPGKACPAWFMNRNLKSLVLIAATDSVASELEVYDLPFDGEGTRFKLQGHYLEHLNDRYLENGKAINLQVIQHINVTSNVGSAKRKIDYFLVTDIL